MKKKKDNERREPKREKNLVLKVDNNDSSGKDGDMVYLTRRFQKMVRRNGGIPKRDGSSKPKDYDLCHKCGKPGHFIKDCPLLKQDQFKHNTDEAAKRNPVPDKRFKRKNVADNVVKQALAAWRDFSNESEKDNDHGDSLMMAVESEATDYDSIFSLMVQSDDDEDDGDNDVRDDLVVVVVDLKETIESVEKEKDVLTKRVANTELERDDLLAVVVDLNDIIKELKGEGRHKTLHKGKEVANETHLRLEDEMKTVKSRLCIELEKNKQLQEELGRVKSDLEKLVKWTWSSDAITAMYINNGGNMQGIGFQREKTPYNPHSKYVNICDKRNKMEFLSKICTVTNLMTGEVVLVAKRYKNIYVSNFESLQSGDLRCLRAIDDDAELWHKRLGNASFSLLNKLVQKDLVRGLPKSSFKEHKVCDATNDETFQVFAAFLKKNQVKMGSNVACIRSDHGTKFDNAKFDEFCVENGITHNFSAPKTPQQNDIVERKNITLEYMARTMLIDSGIAKYFWAEAVNTTCYLISRCMIRSLLNKAPYELLNGRKPKLTHLRTFGCKCFVLNNGKEALGKFDAKSDEGIFLGYSSPRKAYKVYNKRTQCVEESIHAIFDESHLSCEKDIHDDQDGEPLSVPGEVIEMENGKADMLSNVKEYSEDDANTSPSIGEEPGLSNSINVPRSQ
ncbi:uncharacterized protein LOC142169713 [Nicotiana tabacum]|uniref:Uncharacterized protein LOC142169713 n=1 Tax=Nicotiana tabacum TaxID=4097 RepID=A0AC58SRY4_TOBAC